MAATQAERYKRWYDKNKQKLADRRRARYHSDPDYRAKAIENRRRSLPAVEPLPEGYVHTFSDVAHALDVSLWKLRDWRNKNYYPEPHEHGRGLYFTEAQVALLLQLRNFMNTVSHRFTPEAENHLQDLVNFIYANWK